MGFIESMALLAALAGGAYVTVYYVLPAFQQMSMAPYYYMQQQQPPAAPAPTAPAPVTQDATIPDSALDDVTEPTTEEIVEDAVEDELEDAGLVKDAPEEKKDSKKKSSGSSSDDKAYQKQKERHDKTVKESDPKKDSRYKGMTSKQAGAAAKKKLLGRYTEITPLGIKHIVVDEYDIVRDVWYE